MLKHLSSSFSLSTEATFTSFSSSLTLLLSSIGEADSSCSLFNSSLLEYLASASFRVSSRDKG